VPKCGGGRAVFDSEEVAKSSLSRHVITSVVF
jgi:hypothetical protein